MSTAVEWPVSLIDRARELYQAGLSTREVSRLLGPSHTWIKRHLSGEIRTREESRTSRRRYSLQTGIDYDAAEREAIRMYIEGESQHSISRELGVSRGAVKDWLDRNGIKIRDLSEAQHFAAEKRNIEIYRNIRRMRAAGIPYRRICEELDTNNSRIWRVTRGHLRKRGEE